MKTEIEKFQSGFSGMPGVSQNHDGSTKRRLQPILLLDEPLGIYIIMLNGSTYRSTVVLGTRGTPGTPTSKPINNPGGSEIQSSLPQPSAVKTTLKSAAIREKHQRLEAITAGFPVLISVFAVYTPKGAQNLIFRSQAGLGSFGVRKNH